MVHICNSIDADGITMEKTNIENGDTIVLTVDLDKIDIDFLSEVGKYMGQVFPNNKVAIFPKGIEMDVYKG